MYFQGWATPSALENQFVGADWGRPASGLGFQIRQKIQLFEFKMYVFVSRYFLKFGFPPILRYEASLQPNVIVIGMEQVSKI